MRAGLTDLEARLAADEFMPLPPFGRTFRLTPGGEASTGRHGILGRGRLTGDHR
jgi:hypothetical protein